MQNEQTLFRIRNEHGSSICVGRDFLFIRRKGPFVRIGYGNLRAAMYPLILKCFLSFSVIYSCFFSGLRTLTWIHLMVKNSSPLVIGILTLIHGRGGGGVFFCKVSLTLDFKF